METDIILENFKKIQGKNEGDMSYYLSNHPESMGGNAGFWNHLSCMAANFYYDKNNGMIIYFGNCQHVPDSIKNRFKQGTFRIAIDFETGIERIVDVMVSRVSDRAKQNLEDTARVVNLYRSRTVAA